MLYLKVFVACVNFPTTVEHEKAIEEAYTEVVIKATPKIPYPSKPGIQTLLNFIAKTTPEAASAKPDDFVEAKFVKDLEDSGFYARLYREK
jgi:hypothetical protein